MPLSGRPGRVGSAPRRGPRLEIIKDNHIANGLDAFRASFNTVYVDRTISRTLDDGGEWKWEAGRE
ncbi:hypothetical protein C8A01DRAFT_21186 [Parachaetomium inaequale]|uniref:Uncharacterized protein n=1 Tax=Parachaetomium inaequale TaxID=2588326 RepID=A0AAN6SL34_9PEZI|nr:hypothetical protein C8A01DRAFT_21186 [Parachaetomium inaequale]